MADDRPAWARRMYNERLARGWSQADTVRAMRAHSAKELPGTASLLRQYKRWEAGEVTPKEFYQPIIAETFGTVTHAMFPVAPKRDADADVLAVSGMDTLELVSRLQRSDLDQATLDALRIMADRLCSEYPYMPSDQLLTEGRSWLRRVVSFQGQRLTLNQHREILTLAGWIALLIACVEYDSGDRQAAETTRQAALSLGTEADHAEVKAWAHEIRAWIDLTTGNYHGVVAAARTGIEAAPGHNVAIQLAAQEAKAWARIGDRRATEVALDKGRKLLEAMPYPDNLDHHFVVDPTKFDFYSMDCYRHLAEDRLAETLASEVIQASTDFDGTERAPMRLAEARITLGVVAARQGDLEQAIHYGERALLAPRKSLPSLLMVSRDLTRVLNDQYPNEPETQAYLDQLHALSSLQIHGLSSFIEQAINPQKSYHVNANYRRRRRSAQRRQLAQRYPPPCMQVVVYVCCCTSYCGQLTLKRKGTIINFSGGSRCIANALVSVVWLMPGRVLLGGDRYEQIHSRARGALSRAAGHKDEAAEHGRRIGRRFARKRI